MQNYEFPTRKTSFCPVFAIFAENTTAMAKKLNRIEFTLREGEDFIPLISLLKACDVVYSGSEAQEVVTNGMVLRNGEVEYRKRAKIRAGETIIFENYEIFVDYAGE
jgi:ribosome-associated protein